MLRVLYFARLREVFERNSEEIEFTDSVNNVASLMASLRERGEAWEQELMEQKSIRVAVNQDLADFQTELNDGDEVAFFPPVTGG